MNRVNQNVFAIHRCINEGYGLIRIFTEKIRISPRKLWRVCDIDLPSAVIFILETRCQLDCRMLQASQSKESTTSTKLDKRVEETKNLK